MWSVLQRELREQARQGATWWLRVIGGGVMMLLLWLAWERTTPGPGTTGRGFFLGLNRLLLLGIWFVGPVLTADCLSREKREGTLGLLFLTPLRPVDVVVGKAFVHALRAFVFVLAAIPVMVVTVLLGGISWLDALRMLCFQLAALGLALVAGLAASSLTTSWWHSRLLAFAFAAVGAGVFVGLYLCAIVLPAQWQRGTVSGLTLGMAFAAQADHLWARSGFGPGGGFDSMWRDWWSLGASWYSVQLAAFVWVASWLLVTLTVWLTAAGVRRTWRLEPPAVRRNSVERILTGVWISRDGWRRRQTRMLDRNPICWLQSRSWSARAGGWLLTLGALAAVWLTTTEERRGAMGFGSFLRPLFLGVAAFVATASFRSERESGALELWLVTPLTPAAIVGGRLTGLAARLIGPLLALVAVPYFTTAALLLMGLELSPGRQQWLSQRSLLDGYFILWLVTTTMFGLGLSLSRLSFLTAFALAWIAHHAPYVGTAVIDWLVQQAGQAQGKEAVSWDSDLFLYGSGLALAATLALWGWSFGRRQLAERRFVAGFESPRLPADANLSEVRAP